MPAHKLTSEEAKNLLLDVREDWLAFWFNHGRVAKNLPELAAELAATTEEQFVHHVNNERNDLAKWTDEVIGDAVLAQKLRLLTTAPAARLVVERRVAELRLSAQAAAETKETAPATQEAAPAEAKAEAPKAASAVSAASGGKTAVRKPRAKKVAASAKGGSQPKADQPRAGASSSGGKTEKKAEPKKVEASAKGGSQPKADQPRAGASFSGGKAPAPVAAAPKKPASVWSKLLKR